MPIGFAETLAAARRGEPAAMEELLQRHLPGIQAVVRLKAGPRVLQRESVSDLAQSVCREVLESLESFREGGEDELRGWIYKLTLRKLHDRHRHVFAGRRDVRREVAVDGSPSAWDQACQAFGTPSREAIGNEAQARLDAAFAELDDEQQNVVVWSRFVGLPHREIAELIGKSEVATRKILSRALLRLAESVDAG